MIRSDFVSSRQLSKTIPLLEVKYDELMLEITIFYGRLIKHVNAMDENIFLSYSSPSCYLAALHNDHEQVFLCLQLLKQDFCAVAGEQ